MITGSWETLNIRSIPLSVGMSKADIAKAEGTHKSRITRSIEAGLRSLEKYFKEIL